MEQESAIKPEWEEPKSPIPNSARLSDAIDSSPKDNLNIEVLAAALDPDPADPLNPQNWPKWKKTSVFLALMSSSILCDGGMTWGASLFVAQTFEWDISMSLSTTSVNYGILLQGFGGVFAVPFIEHYGRQENSQFIRTENSLI